VDYLESGKDINKLLDEKVLAGLPEKDINEDLLFAHIKDNYLTP
jgi:hypothetical protein